MDREGRAGRSVAGVLGSALGVALTGGLAAGVLLGGSIAWLNDWGPGLDLLAICAHLAGLYAAVFAAGLLAAALFLLAVGGRPGPRIFAALVVGFCVFLTGVLRFSQAVQFLAITPALNLLGIVDLIGVGIGSLAFTGAVLSSTRIRIWGALAFGCAVFAGLHLLNRWNEQPIRLDLASEVPPLVAGAAPPAPAPPEARFEKARVFVLALDGLTWNVLLPLLRRDELPAFRALLDGAAYGYLDTLDFTVSPVIWETVATGKSERRHGIGHHVHYDFPGVSEPVAHLPNMRLCNTPLGLRRLLAATQSFAPWHGKLASSNESRAARFWEVASRHGVEVGVYGYCTTTPAPALRGFLHGYGVDPPLDHPPDLEERFEPLPPPSRTRPGTEWVREQRPRMQAMWERFVALSLAYRPELLLFYTHFGDGTNHLNWKGEAVGSGLFYSGFGLGEFQPGPAISEAHRFLDAVVSEAMARLPDDGILMIVSDHGFEFRGYEHDHAPPGTIIVRGPGIRPGPIEGARVHDVAPTLAQLLSLPVADDMEGRVLPIAAPGGPLDRPVERVASWGEPLRGIAAGEVDAEKLGESAEYLKALGYVVD